MVEVAQLVRAPDCGSGGRGFKPHLPPHLYLIYLMGRRQAVRQRTLDPPFRWFESSRPSQAGVAEWQTRRT